MLVRKHEWENTTKKASNRYINTLVSELYYCKWTYIDRILLKKMKVFKILVKLILAFFLSFLHAIFEKSNMLALLLDTHLSGNSF